MSFFGKPKTTKELREELDEQIKSLQQTPISQHQIDHFKELQLRELRERQQTGLLGNPSDSFYDELLGRRTQRPFFPPIPESEAIKIRSEKDYRSALSGAIFGNKAFSERKGEIINNIDVRTFHDEMDVIVAVRIHQRRGVADLYVTGFSKPIDLGDMWGACADDLDVVVSKLLMLYG